MKLFKKSERGMKAARMRKVFRESGYKVREVGTFCKWKELSVGGRLQVKLTIWEATDENGVPAYMVEDTLGNVASKFIDNKAEVMGWLKEHGYKTEKRWYLEDCGMTEETWNVWNGKEEGEE